MDRIIDASTNLSPYATEIRKAGIGTVVRYYAPNIKKRIQPAEAAALAEAGLSLMACYEENGGAGGRISDLTAATGQRDGQRALQYAADIRQPAGSAIYFAVDWDFVAPADLASIVDYCAAAKQALAGRYRMGVYGSGLVCLTVQKAGLAEFIWLSLSTGWTGYKACLASGHTTLIQKPTKKWPGDTFDYDEDVPGQGFTDIGAFTPGSAPTMVAPAPRGALYAVNARTGLNLRNGPGTDFPFSRTLAPGTIVHGLSQTGPWVQADVEGDGQADGYLHANFLTPAAGEIPNPPNAARKPYDFAQQELALHVAEVPGPGDNPRIVAYHATTVGGPAHDSVAWCSSFVNWCVEQVGIRGTDSKWARSWHDMGWGTDVTAAPRTGDIAVFAREFLQNGQMQHQGHVGFFVENQGGGIALLAGNQGDRVSVATYPRSGVVGGQTFTLLSIRRGPGM